MTKITYKYQPNINYYVPINDQEKSVENKNDKPYIKNINKQLQAPLDIYGFLIDSASRKAYVVPDAPYEILVLQFDNGETFELSSCHRLFERNNRVVASDHGITSKNDVNARAISNDLKQFKHIFNELIRLNKIDKTPNKADLGNSASASSPNL